MDLIGKNMQQTYHTGLSHKSADKDEDHLPLEGVEIEETGAPFNGQEHQQVDKREETQHAGGKKIDEHSEKEGIDAGPLPSGMN